MKNIKKCILVVIISSLIICLMPIKNRVFAIDSSYSFNEYQTTMLTVGTYDEFNRINFIENNTEIVMDIDTLFRYVVVNGVTYTYDDVVSAAKIQSDSIFEENQNITILDALYIFEPINDFDEYLMQTPIANTIASIGNEDMIFPNAYNVEYYVGTYEKPNMLFSMTGTAISLLISFWVTSSYGNVAGIASSFVSDFLIGIGVSSVTTSAYYKKYQTVLNSGGTTREGRQFGAWDKVEDCTIWNVDANGNKICVYHTYETIRPGY